MAIFQWLPYGGKKYDVITKIFPNKDYNKNMNDLVEGKLELAYEAYFPEEINKDKIDDEEVFMGVKHTDNSKLERHALLEILNQNRIEVGVPFTTKIRAGKKILLD